MRARAALVLAPCAAAAMGFAACSGEPVSTRAPLSAATEGPPIAAPQRPSYVLSDPTSLPASMTAQLDDGAIGVVMDGGRVVSRDAGVRFVSDQGVRISRVERIPPWLGGGFLFVASGTLYASEAFDGPLRPIVALPSSPSRMSFGPRGALARANDGHRFMIDLATGAPMPMAVAGLVDIAALADGRAAALTDTGQVFLSSDRGDHWTDAAGLIASTGTQLNVLPAEGAAPPAAGAASDAGAPGKPPAPWGEIWIDDASGRFYRLEPGGGLREFPSRPKPQTPSKRTRGWSKRRGHESPLTAVVRRGERLDADTAVIAADGNVVRVDVRTGAAEVIVEGRLPPDLPCEAVRAPDEVIFVCASSGQPSAIIAGAVNDRAPRIERTFPVDGPFFASDDGVLLFGGACDGSRAGLTACVRDGRGEWHEVGIDLPTDGGVEGGADAAPFDAGAPAKGKKKPAPPSPSSVNNVIRWIPRADRRPLAVMGGSPPTVLDPATSVMRPLQPDGSDGIERVTQALVQRDSGRIVDRRWTATEIGAIRGWLDGGRAVTISPEGEIARSVFRFDRAATAGPFGFARDHEGRAFQTTDRGEAWIEVTAPPNRRPFDVQRCTAIGCDLGAWVRLGWEPTRPEPAEDPRPIAPAPALASPPLRKIACAPAGSEKLDMLGADPVSGISSFGFGVRRVDFPRSEANGVEIQYRRGVFGRGPGNPAFGSLSDDAQVLRAFFHGYEASFSQPERPHPPFDGITVAGPRRDGTAFRRDLDFVDALDPAGTVRSASFELRALLPFATALRVPLWQMFAGEGPVVVGLVPIAPIDAAGAGGVVIALPTTMGPWLFAIARGDAVRGAKAGAAAKATLRFAGLAATDGLPVSAIETPGGVSVLVVGSGGPVVLEITASGVAATHHLADPPGAQHPPNADALALGPGGALAILRTPSGMLPPTAGDPATILPLGGGPRVLLAPWSTLTSAGDPACKADTSGWRATITTAGPWIALLGSRLTHSPSGAMTARVRWSAQRVCLEAVEVPDATLAHHGEELETEVVARFVSPEAAGRLGFSHGVELRQPLTCKLAPP